MEADMKVGMETGMKVCFNNDFNDMKVKYRADY